MGITIEIEYEESKIINFLFPFYCFFRYLNTAYKNYKKIRSKSKVPKFTDIDFNRTVYPFIFFFIFAPIVFATLFHQYIGDGIMTVLGIAYFLFLFLAGLTVVVYVLYRLIIDIAVSGICFVDSFIKTSVRAFNIIKNILRNLLSYILQHF